MPYLALLPERCLKTGDSPHGARPPSQGDRAHLGGSRQRAGVLQAGLAPPARGVISWEGALAFPYVPGLSSPFTDLAR